MLYSLLYRVDKSLCYVPGESLHFLYKLKDTFGGSIRIVPYNKSKLIRSMRIGPCNEAKSFFEYIFIVCIVQLFTIFIIPCIRISVHICKYDA